MKILKALTVAAALAAAVITPAKAELGMVDFHNLKPVACHSFNDAIEASKFNNWEDIMRNYQAKREFVKRHGFSSSVLFNDCVIAGDQSNGDTELLLTWAIQIKRLPTGMIATCVVVPGGLPNLDGSRAPDCGDKANPDKGAAVGYWVVTKPEGLMRNFDLPRGN